MSTDTVDGDNRVVRRARPSDVWAIAALVNGYAAEDVMLPRSVEQVTAALDDYVVAADAHGHLLACAALREYSPSLAELVSVAVSRDARGRGLGSVVVAEVERIARARGFDSLFAHTMSPCFFQAIGYAPAERAHYPEKTCRATTTCVARALVAAPVYRAPLLIAA